MTEPAYSGRLTPDASESFRPIQYLGNKTRVLEALNQVVTDLVPPGALVGDPFAGSGVVARRISETQRVRAGDIQEYSRVLTSALLRPAPPSAEQRQHLLALVEAHYSALHEPAVARVLQLEKDAIGRSLALDATALADMVERGSFLVASSTAAATGDLLHTALRAAATALPLDVGSVMTHVYAGPYFGYEQALRLDSLRSAIATLPSEQRDTAVAALLGAASECVSTIGSHFAQPLRARAKDGSVKVSALRRAAKKRQLDPWQAFDRLLDRYTGVSPVGLSSHVVRSDYRAFLAEAPEDMALVYADPPYTRDHYSRFYHVLETLAQGDVPGITGETRGRAFIHSRALYRQERHQSPFCIKSQVIGAFNALFDGVKQRGIPLVLSYSPYEVGTAARPHPRLVTIQQLADMASRHFKRVRVQDAGTLVHSKFNQSAVNVEAIGAAEVFVVAQP